MRRYSSWLVMASMICRRRSPRLGSSSQACKTELFCFQHVSTNFNYFCASRPSFVRHQLVLVRVCFVSGVYLVVVALRSALWNQFQQGCFVLLLTPLLVS